MAKVYNRGGFWWILCPACKVNHRFDTRWTYNYDESSPTFDPRLESLTIMPTAKVTDRVPGDTPVPPNIRIYCLARVQNGYIEFDPKSTHTMAGHVLKLPDWDTASWEEQKKVGILENGKEVIADGQRNEGLQGEQGR